MVHPNFEALYAAHPSVPRTIVRKIYEWKVSRDPDICPLYGNLLGTEGTGATTTPETGGSDGGAASRSVVGGNSAAPSKFPIIPSYYRGFSRGLLMTGRKAEPLIITMSSKPEKSRP